MYITRDLKKKHTHFFLFFSLHLLNDRSEIEWEFITVDDDDERERIVYRLYTERDFREFVW